MSDTKDEKLNQDPSSVVIDLKPTGVVQAQVSSEPRLSQVHNLVPQGCNQTAKAKKPGEK